MDKSGALFPLNCADMGLLALRCANESPHFHWLLKLDGEIDCASLNRAALAVFNAHPNLKTKLHMRSMKPVRRIHDVSEANVVTSLDLSHLQRTEGLTDKEVDLKYAEAVGKWLNSFLNPFAELPARFLYIKKGLQESYLIVAIDHSSMDGIRSVRFVREVVRVYNGGACSEGSFLRDFRLGNSNELVGIAGNKRASASNFYLKMLYSLIYRFLIAPWRPPARVYHDRSGKSVEISHHLGFVSPEETQQLRLKTKAAGVTVNDLLVAACYRAIEKWNRSHGKGANKITVMIPIDIGTATLKSSISNQISFISLPTLPRERAEPMALLRRIRAKMAYNIEHGLSFSMVYLLHFFSYAPLPFWKALVRVVMFTRVYVDTILLTNLGAVWHEAWGEPRLGGAKIADMNLIVPVVTPMGLSLGTTTFRGSLHVCLSYRTAMFSKQKAQEFLDLYLQEIRDYPLG